MLSSLLHLIFPKNCHSCGNAITDKLENICLNCRNELPYTYASAKSRESLEKLFRGRIQLQKIAAFLKFEKGGKVQQLIHRMKYQDQKEIGHTLGEMAAAMLKEENFFENIDLLIPIPIHPFKERRRGYNQSQYIAEGVEMASGVKLDSTSVKKSIHTDSQTRKEKFKRWENVSASFEVIHEKELQGKHLLLIDDVITTGATIEACAAELQKIKGVKISILSMAFTY